MDSFGTLQYIQGFWRVSNLPPHVSMRFKSMFGGIPLGTVPPFMISNRPDTAADLDWFMQRYPLDMETKDKTILQEGLQEYDDIRMQVESIRAPDYTPPKLEGFKDGNAPFGYQATSAELMRRTGRQLLLDDVGLGKTLSALATIADGWGLPAAIVVQPHLSRQWITKYIERFTHLKAYEVKSRKVEELPPADVYIFRYSNVGAWADYAKTLGCKTVIFDEIQELRHGRQTEKGAGAKAFAEVADNRMGLTATPIYNYGSEMWNVVEYVAPGALGTWHEFLINWCVQSGNNWIVKDPEALGAYLEQEGITLRRTNEHPQVARQLPKARKVLFEVDWDEGAVETDRELQRKLAMRVLNGTWHERGQASRELDIMLRHDTGVAKARATAAYVRSLVEAGNKVLVGGWHRKVYDIWNEALADLNPVLFTGSETVGRKQKSQLAFEAGDTDVMFMSLRSGAGLDGLQEHCHEVVFGELDWSPQAHQQFTGRVLRYGQTEEVTSHFIWTDNGSDPVIMPTLGLKASQSHGILNPYGGMTEAAVANESRMKEMAKYILEKTE